MSTFQFIVVTVFVAFTIIGVGAFALFGGVFGGSGIGPVVVWGTLPQTVGEDLVETLKGSDGSLQDVQYLEQDVATYEETLLNAMASGVAPDLFMVGHDQMARFSDKVVVIPYSILSQSEFTSSFVDEGSLFLTGQGALALPFLIDPMVMYWNRDLFASAGVAQPPQFWNDFLTLAPKMYSANAAQSITRSAVALGQWSNIAHAKDILSTLFMQAGEPIVGRTATGKPVSVFGIGQSTGNNPAESALRFYTEFSNPGRSNYSWNRSLPRSDQAFTSGRLGVYFGYASELGDIAAVNPNLRFAVATMPQLQGAGTRLTFGRLTGLAIPRGARNINGASVVAQKLTSAPAATILMQFTGLPSPRRDVAIDTRSNAAAEVFVQSTIMARGWIDPNPTESDRLFRTMIESVVSGAQDPAGAVSEAAQEFSRLLPNN